MERSENRILSCAELQRRLGRPGERAAQVVFTNGCFDLLHTGHAVILEAARALGDLLVVGINSDASVQRLKGPARPLVPIEQRALLIASLRSVDYVVVFEEDTPLELITALVPDILVKGEDYPLERIVGREVVESHGGRIARLPLVGGLSTTDLLARIRTQDG